MAKYNSQEEYLHSKENLDKLKKNRYPTPMLGKTQTEEAKQKIRNSHFHTHLKGNINMCEKNGNWKGDTIGKEGIHGWIRNRRPKPLLCENCGLKESYDLANISEEYKRDVNDFKWLCRSCHSKKHRGIEWHKMIIGGKQNAMLRQM